MGEIYQKDVVEAFKTNDIKDEFTVSRNNHPFR